MGSLSQVVLQLVGAQYNIVNKYKRYLILLQKEYSYLMG